MVEATLAAIKYNLSFFSKGLLIFFLILSVLAPSYVLWVLYPQKNLLPLPDDLISIQSRQGNLFLESTNLLRADLELLLRSFQPQETTSFCGVASGVTVINALGGNLNQWTFFKNTDAKSRTFREVLFEGMSLEHLSSLLKNQNVSANITYASDINEATFREALYSNLSNPLDFIIVNYQRKMLGQGRGGHISPIAAIEKESDYVLILDTAAHKYPPTWVKLSDLYKAMNTQDSSTDKSRGFITIKPDNS